MKQYYIVAAAGVGKRMGLGYPKQFLEYNRKPIFVNAIEVLEDTESVDEIIIVTNEEYIETVRELVAEYALLKVTKIVSGGKERQDSIYNALKEIEDDDSIVGIQDGVRPFLKKSCIEGCMKELAHNNKLSGVITGVPVKDTIKKVDENGDITETPRRSELFAAQTPQVFRTKDLKEAFESAYKEGFYGTDDASLLERIGKVVGTFTGDYDNIKITTQEDLIFLEKKFGVK